MPVVTVLPDRLELRLTPAERMLAFHRGDVVVERSSIRSATVTEDPWIWVRGIRAPGTAVPLTVAIGTWKFHGGKDFLLIKRRPSAVVIDLADEDYSRLIISTRHAQELIAALQLGTTTAAIPVIETDDLVIVPEVAEQAAERAAAAKRPAEPEPATPEAVADAPEEAAVPRTSAPKSSAPKTSAPRTSAPKSSAPRPPASEASAPRTPAPQRPAAAEKPADTAEKPSAPETPTAKPRKPATARARTPRADPSVGHASAEPSGATEAAE